MNGFLKTTRASRPDGPQHSKDFALLSRRSRGAKIGDDFADRLALLGDRQVPRHYSEEDLAEDLDYAFGDEPPSEEE